MEKAAIYKSFLRWRAKPITEEDPQTIEEFCIKYKIDNNTIIEFVKSETYYDDLLVETLNWAKAQTPELLHTVYANLKLSKSVNDLSKFLEVVHGIKQKDEDKKNINNFNFFGALEDDQYQHIVRREAKLLNKGSKKLPA